MFIGYINSLTRKCYQQAFSSFQLETRDTIVELNCKFSSLLIRKNKCLKLKTRDRTKKRKTKNYYKFDFLQRVRFRDCYRIMTNFTKIPVPLL